MSAAGPFLVTSDGGHSRSFRTFAAAEKYARAIVAASAADRFAVAADIWGPEEASIRLDPLGRVWTDLGPPGLRVRPPR